MTGPKMDRQVSNNPMDVDVEEIRPILEGRLDDLPPISSRVVRVFICSTFSDMVHERNVLMEHVYPKLKEFCRNKYGLEFQLIDLRWGIQEESQDDHTMVDFCLKEIENCQKTSVGPSFVALLGQKYGYRPLPAHITEVEFLAIRSSLEKEGLDISLIDSWYKCDENVVPPFYILQPISSVLEHYCDKTNPDLQAADQISWAAISQSLLNLLREGATLCAQEGSILQKAKDKYFVSVTEMEMVQGMLDCDQVDGKSIYFRRTVDGLEENLTNPRVQNFLDLVPESLEVDEEATSLLVHLRDEKVCQIECDDCRMDSFHLQWRNTDSDPNDDHGYLDDFKKSFYGRITHLIDQSMTTMRNLVSDSQVVEIVQHLLTCKSRCEVFQGRDGTLSKIQSYLCGNETDREMAPLVVYGESGCGKTSVMAKAATLVHEWFPDANPVLILRFLGTSARSASIRLNLGSICWQIAAAYASNFGEIPTDYRMLISYFHNLLQVATAERPLIILLDSLDQLATSHNAHNLVWLPQQLPPYVRLVVSTLPDEYKLLKTLKTVVEKEEQYIQITPLGQQCCLDILQTWLTKSSRRLTDEQYCMIAEALFKCNLPLYTKVVFDEVSRWRSYETIDTISLASTIKGIINTLFQRLEKKHGVTFVVHALAYVTASRNGLSDPELEDVLSLDDTVLNDVYTHWVPPVRRIPPVMWPRLHSDLASYIVEREANGILVYYWYHRQFIAVAKERYLSDPDLKRELHSTLADYFIGSWAGGRKKPFLFSKGPNLSVCENEADRKVASQPLILCRDSQGRPTYNLRKLVELPYQLLMSGRIEDLKQLVLFNYDWLHIKLAGISLQDVLSDFRLLDGTNFATDAEIQLVCDSLRVGGSFLNRNPDTLGFDLTARLLPYYDEYPNIRKLLQACDKVGSKVSALVPLLQCFEAPQAALLYVLEDHSKMIIDVIFNRKCNEVISVAGDGTVSFWDLESGERTKVLDVSFVQPGRHTKLRRTEDGNFVICDSDRMGSPALVIDAKRGQVVRQIGEKMSSSSRRCVLVQNLLVREKNLYRIESGEKIAHLDEFFKSIRYLTVSITHDESLLIVGEEENIHVFDLDTKFLLTSVPAKNTASCIVITADNKFALVGYAVSCEFRVIDIEPDSETFGMVVLEYGYPTSFPGLAEGHPLAQELAEIVIANKDPFQLLLNFKRCSLVLFHMDSRESRLVDTEAISSEGKIYIYSSNFSADDSYIFAAQANYLHVWETATGTILTSIELHISFEYPLAASQKRNLVATGSNLETAIKVWNLDNLKLMKSAMIYVYHNPVDMVTVARKKQLVFVKAYYPFNSRTGYKKFESFGIEVWDLSTGNRGHYLPFGKYGILEQMEVSPDAYQMALLIKSRSSHYLVITNLHSNHIDVVLEHAGANRFTICADWSHCITIAAEKPGDGLACLWDIRTGKKVSTVDTKCDPVFTSDSSRLLSLANDNLYVCHLDDSTHGQTLPVSSDAFRLQAIPGSAGEVMILYQNDASSEEPYCTASVHNHMDNCDVAHLKNLSRSGIRCFSEDGSLGVDGFLQVFCLKTGAKIQSLPQSSTAAELPRDLPFVKMTGDGQYVIWCNQDLTIKAARVKDGQFVANVCTHEKIVSLESLLGGYLVTAGRADGRLLTLKLQVQSDSGKSVCQECKGHPSVEGKVHGEPNFQCQRYEQPTFQNQDQEGSVDDGSGRVCCFCDQRNAQDRRLRLLSDCRQEEDRICDSPGVGEGAVSLASESIQQILKEKATVPHSIILTSQRSSLEETCRGRNRFSSVISLTDFFTGLNGDSPKKAGPDSEV